MPQILELVYIFFRVDKSCLLATLPSCPSTQSHTWPRHTDYPCKCSWGHFLFNFFLSFAIVGNPVLISLMIPTAYVPRILKAPNNSNVNIHPTPCKPSTIQNKQDYPWTPLPSWLSTLCLHHSKVTRIFVNPAKNFMIPRLRKHFMTEWTVL